MRWVKSLLCCLFLAVTIVGMGAAVFAADLKSQRQDYPDDRDYSSRPSRKESVAEFCYSQRHICQKICSLRSKFDDRFDGCPNSCISREMRCGKGGCYRWSEQEMLIAERFGGFKCIQ